MHFSLRSAEGNQVEVYDSFGEVDETAWNSVVDGRNIYLTSGYLSSLHEALNDKMAFRYLIIKDKEGKPLGVAACQILDFKTSASDMKGRIINWLNLKILVCGNVFNDGENGYLFRKGEDQAKMNQLLGSVLHKLAGHRKNGRTSLILIKDFWPSSDPHLEPFHALYEEFSIDVNMVLKVSDSWHSMDDYKSCMVTKYRTKCKQVIKKSCEIEMRSLSATEIREQEEQIDTLYQQVLNSAEFKLGELNAHAFALMKERVGTAFRFNAYYLAGKLVGFSTSFVLEDAIDCNYVGIEYEINRSHALYQRMLYDFVELAINEQKQWLNYGRTAELIKSGLGAEPVNMKLFGRHRKDFINMFIRSMIGSIHPREFEIRRPFKQEYYE